MPITLVKPSLLAAVAFFLFIPLANACDLNFIPRSPLPADQLLSQANLQINQQKHCQAAVSLLQAYDRFPREFVQANGLFTLIKIEMDLGKYDKALEAYKLWPWEFENAQNYLPWDLVPPGQEDAVQFIVWKLFSRYIPKNADVCVENPLTHKCDEANGLYDYDKTFEAKFPNSPYIQQMREITTLYYRYKIKHEKQVLKYYISSFQDAPKESAKSQSALKTIIDQCLKMKAISRPDDQAEIDEVILKYKNLLRKK